MSRNQIIDRLRELADEDGLRKSDKDSAAKDRNAPLDYWCAMSQRHKDFRQENMAEAVWLLVWLAATSPDVSAAPSHTPAT